MIGSIQTQSQLSIMDGFLNLVRVHLHPHQVPLMHTALAHFGAAPQMLPENQVGPSIWQMFKMKVSYLLKQFLVALFSIVGCVSNESQPRSDLVGTAHQEWASQSRNEESTVFQPRLLKLGEHQVENYGFKTNYGIYNK